MSDEFWAIIGVGIGGISVVGVLFTLLNMRISDLRKGQQHLSDAIVLSEKRLNDRIDGLEENFREDLRQVNARIDRVETNLNARIDAVETNLGARIDRVETNLNARIDGVDDRLRVVEQGQARVIGAVEMMQTIVVATLRGEEVSAD